MVISAGIFLWARRDTYCTAYHTLGQEC